ncbi:MAG TPA: uroporphyrinogen decarboxylase family protein [bacterium]|nr:uroporphyrinogen decarboxylase family protein [bacterium]
MTFRTPFQDRPDFEHMRQVLMRETKQGPVPLLEFEVDPEHMIELSGNNFPLEKLPQVWNVVGGLTIEIAKLGIQLMDLSIAFSEATNYDYVTMLPIVSIPTTPMQIQANPQQGGKMRAWQGEHDGLINNREEFDAYPWPHVNTVNILPIQYAAPRLPPGSKVMALIVGIFENLRALMGFEGMAVATVDQPDLVQDILERLTVLTVNLVDKAAAHPATGAIFYADDMAFNTQTMISPKLLREWVIPRHQRIAQACHKHGKPFLLHACGQIDPLMEDLIEVVGIDAKHSFQDNIEPVEETYFKYGGRISIIGGLDVDLMARGTEAEVRKRARQILETCAPDGGFCMGSGNSVTNFCKMENYLAMVDETRQWNQEHA